jgi:hypothetical protein
MVPKYDVVEIIPGGQGWAATTPVSVEVTANGDQTVTFGNWKPIDITAYKFRDSNGDGHWDTNEDPIQGWEIRLYKAGTNEQWLDSPGWTDASGKVTFTVDKDGAKYDVAEIIPPGQGWVATTPVSVEVTADGMAADVIFGNWIPMDITASKFYDVDQDGIWGANEDPIEGWMIELRDGVTDALLDVQYTDVTGAVVWTVDSDGTKYTVAEVMPLDTATVFWFNTTDMEVTFDASGDIDIEFGNVAKERAEITGYGVTRGGWSNQNGRAMLSHCYPHWVDLINSLHLVWPNGDPFEITNHMNNDQAHAQLAGWIVGQGVGGNRSYAMGAQLAAIALNLLCGPDFDGVDGVFHAGRDHGDRTGRPLRRGPSS